MSEVFVLNQIVSNLWLIKRIKFVKLPKPLKMVFKTNLQLVCNVSGV